MQVLPGESDEVVSIVRSISLGCEVQIKSNSCLVMSGPRIGEGIKSEKDEETVDAAYWAEKARVVHEALMEQLVEV
jgi:hypothetical protein